VTATRSTLSATLAALVLTAGCHDVSSFSTGSGNRYVGPVVPADFVLSGVGSSAQLCLLLDADHLQDAPGSISTSDGMFRGTALRPIPQLWHDPLSTFTFGEGRIQNLLYIATPTQGADVTVVLSLMDGGGVEARLVRGAPPAVAADASSTPTPTNVFAVFTLSLQQGVCPF
jgi:hypothetical protein